MRLFRRRQQDSPASTKYIYRPLDNSPDAIRLLHLLPLTNENEPISCLLTHEDLGNKPRYVALSYCWGDASRTSQIFVNRSPLSIRRNLASALLHIRKHFASGLLGADLPRAFWIDEICINQEDLVERAGQVAIMNTVFGSATNVVSWLGSDEGALSATQDFSSSSPNRIPLSISLPSRTGNRIWIVQEIVLTKPEDIFILYGDELISLQDVQIFRDSWLMFLKTLQLDRKWKQALPSWVPDLRSKRIDSPVWDATLSSSIEMDHPSTNYSFGEQTTRVFPHIRDERLLHARGVWVDKVVQVNRIDYAHAAEDIVDFCTTHLSASNTDVYSTGIPLLNAIFRVLMCGINRFNPSPSNAESSLIHRELQVSHGADQLQLTRTMPLLQAVAKMLAQRGNLSPDNVDDFVLDTLRSPSAPLGTSIYDVRLAGAFIQFLLTSHRQEGNQDFSILQDIGLAPGPNFSQSFLRCFFQERAEILQQQVTFDLFQDEQTEALIGSFQRYFTTFNQAIFVTARGLLGNGPACTALGDRLVFLDGAQMPFVLRKETPETFIFVGPSYVEGLSDGEAAGMARRGEIPVVDILIS